nr:Fatty acid oxidation complex subunit alpha [Acinetobacter gerneri]
MQRLKILKLAIDAVKANGDIKGLIVTSAKSTFIVGADITEFDANFAQGEQAIVDWALPVHDIFNAFEDLEIPKVPAINGMALGGGFEMCLVCDYRVMSDAAQVGLPEIKLGIFPGFGGTVRLSRLIGIDNAVEWMAMANPKKPVAALKDGAVDAVVAADKLQDACN